MINVRDSVNVSRRHNNLSVMFRTSNAGNQPGTGGYKNLTCVGPSESYKVTYGPGMTYVTGYYSISGTIIIFGDTQYTVSLSA